MNQSCFNRTRNTTIAETVKRADNFFTRFKGLLGTKSLPVGQGLLLSPCKQIHMIGMKYAIDAVFVDTDLKVVAVIHSIGPGQISPLIKTARSCLELPAGIAIETETVVGDQLELIDQ
ncbi:MAG: DUF192 domain-containing protein [Candidatus Obscuribacterales bacterium]|nr:DUF192 domain-containing protein [Candidatus Obscuribacterales bacterium]